MLVLIVLGISILLARMAGYAGVEVVASWAASTRVGMAVMLFFTASAHFNHMRHDLVRMVPPWVPRPREVVYLTGVCEILGAIGLLVPTTRAIAASALILFMTAVFPANVHAARTSVTLRGKPVTPLWLRAPMQLLFMALIAWSGLVAR